MRSSISGAEAADRLAIRVVDGCAHCADGRDAKGQMALFTEDTHFVVFMDAKTTQPSMEWYRLLRSDNRVAKLAALDGGKGCSRHLSCCRPIEPR